MTASALVLGPGLAGLRGGHDGDEVIDMRDPKITIQNEDGSSATYRRLAHDHSRWERERMGASVHNPVTISGDELLDRVRELVEERPASSSSE